MAAILSRPQCVEYVAHDFKGNVTHESFFYWRYLQSDIIYA